MKNTPGSPAWLPANPWALIAAASFVVPAVPVVGAFFAAWVLA